MTGRSEPLRWAVIGAAAGVGAVHRSVWDAPERRVVAIADAARDRGRRLADELGVPLYPDADALLRAGHELDAVAILTPHVSHAEIALICIEAGLHVLIEKPMCLTVADADRVKRAAEDADVVLAAAHQHRFRSSVQHAKRLLDARAIGDLQHVTVRAAWPRSRAYYDASPWRGTWVGEGGGVLVNQAPHLLDLLCHLVGLPDEVQAQWGTQMHTIETEDTIDALLRWSTSGAPTGNLHVTTAQALQPERIELHGTLGALELTPTDLLHRRMPEDLGVLVASSEDPYLEPSATSHAVVEDGAPGTHAQVYADVERAIRTGQPPEVGGASAHAVVELMNAILLAAASGERIRLPVDRGRVSAWYASKRGEAVA
jgi:predicted dehydrogenase